MSYTAQFHDSIVRNAACVLAGIKPATLFSFVPRRARSDGRPRRPLSAHGLERAVRAECDSLNQRLRGRGVRADLLYATRNRALLLVSRPHDLDALLRDAEVAGFLAAAGYATENAARVIASLRERVGACERARGRGRACRASNACAACPARTFPHEIGVLLGYPLADVRGFIEHGGRDCVAVGPWKVYGDAESARLQWDRMRTCKHRLAQRYAEGVPLEALVA